MSQSIVDQIETAAKSGTRVARYHGSYMRSKSWATKLVDQLFTDPNGKADGEIERAIKCIKRLSPEAKAWASKYIADGWYYPKYDAQRAAFD